MPACPRYSISEPVPAFPHYSLASRNTANRCTSFSKHISASPFQRYSQRDPTVHFRCVLIRLSAFPMPFRCIPFSSDANPVYSIPKPSLSIHFRFLSTSLFACPLPNILIPLVAFPFQVKAHARLSFSGFHLAFPSQHTTCHSIPVATH